MTGFIFKALWINLRLIQRLKFKFSSSNINLSVRRALTQDLMVLKRTDELLPKLDYKISSDADFRRVIQLKSVVLNPKSGVLWKQGSIIRESSVWDTFSLIKWEPKPRIAKTFQYDLINLPDNGFFHFLIEDLPRFIEAYELRPNTRIVMGSNRRYLTDAMQILKIKNFEVFNYPLRVKSITFSEKIPGYLFSADDKKLLSRISINKGRFGEGLKLFIKRQDVFGKKSNSRGLPNQELIEKILKKLNFQVHILENLSLSEQINLFSQAKVVVGFHGAGLANLVWMFPESMVIELVYERFTRHFEFIADKCSINYRRIKISEFLHNPSAFLIY